MHAFTDVLAWLASMFHALTGKLIHIWEKHARPLLRVLGACIWSVLVLLVGAGLMLLSGQGLLNRMENFPGSRGKPH
jgi:hypothetical protein